MAPRRITEESVTFDRYTSRAHRRAPGFGVSAGRFGNKGAARLVRFSGRVGVWDLRVDLATGVERSSLKNNVAQASLR